MILIILFVLLLKVNAHSDAPGRVAIRDSPGRTSWPVTSEHIRVKSGSPAPCAKRNLHDQITSGNFVNKVIRIKFSGRFNHFLKIWYKTANMCGDIQRWTKDRRGAGASN